MPAALSRAVTVASYGDVHPSRIFDPHVVGMSVVVNTSLSASGTPASGDGRVSPADDQSIHTRRLGQRFLVRDVQERVV